MKGSILIALLIETFLSNAQSHEFKWVKSFGGIYDDNVTMTIDANGNIYTTGSFSGKADFDPGIDTFFLSSTAYKSTYMQKLDASGNFIWAKMIESNFDNYGSAITTDAQGNVFVSGTYSGATDFDPGAAIYNLPHKAALDVYILKLDASGNFLWARNIGGSSADYSTSISVDPKGNVYTSGSFIFFVDFDPGPGTHYIQSKNTSNTFILKLTSSGNFKWVRQLGGFPVDMELDESGNIYTTGMFLDGPLDFDPGTHTFNLTANGNGYDIFVSKLDSNGAFIWAKKIGGNNDNYLNAMTLDSQNNIYLTGAFADTTDFDPDSSTFNLSSNGHIDIFIAKLDSLGNFMWAKNIGGDKKGNGDMGYSIDVNFSGVYTTGIFVDTADFDPGLDSFKLSTSHDWNRDIFILKLDHSGNFKWANKIGGKSHDGSSKIIVDDLNNIYTAGTFNSTVDFDPGAGTYNLTCPDTFNIFIHKMGPGIVGLNEEVKELSNIRIYPNPSNGLFKIALPDNHANTNIELYDLMGKKIYVKENCSGSIDLNISNYSKGIYFVKLLKGGKLIESRKIIKY